MTRAIVATERVQLVPVLEVEPYRFSPLPLPDTCPARAYPAAWNDFFERCMADAGFAGVHALGAGASFVDAHALVGHPLLDRLIREAVGEPDAPDLERVAALAGGLALLVDGAPAIWPGCCGDLGNLGSWQHALAHRPRDGDLWIGHPQLRVAFEGTLVTLTEQWEYPPAPEYLVELAMPAAWLAAAVDVAATDVARFRADLEPLVARLLGAPALAGPIADALIGTC